MSAIPLRIFVHGLIALAPASGPGGSNQISALLVDARAPHIEECVSAHRPKLRFVVVATALSTCGDAGCRPLGSLCECADEALERREIALRITPPFESIGSLLSEAPAQEIPQSASQAGSMGYVANLALAPFGLRLDQKYLSSSPPSHLLARMTIPFSTVTACSLAKRRDNGTANIHSLSFRGLGEEGDSGDTSQALAQMVVAELQVPDAGAGPQRVELLIRDLDGGNEKSMELRPGDLGYQIELSNESEELPPDAPCDDGVARHFSHYYQLAENPPPPEERKVPHVRFTAFRRFAGLNPAVCRNPTFTMNDRPICPMASFFQP